MVLVGRRQSLLDSHPSCRRRVGQPSYARCCGRRIDVAVQTGANTDMKVGLLLASVNNDAVRHATTASFAFGADSTTTAKLDLRHYVRLAERPVGVRYVFKRLSALSPARLRAWRLRVDFSGVTFSTGAFKSTGFQVGPSGATTVAGLTSTGAIPAQLDRSQHPWR